MKRSLLAVLSVCILTSGCSSQPEAEDDLVSARKAYVERQYLDAERLYERYLKSHQKGEERWEVWNRLYELAYNVRNNSIEASELLESMYLEYGDQPDRALDILYRLGNLAMQTRNMDKAVEIWQRLINLPSSSSIDQVTAYRNIGEAYIATGDYDLALDAFRSCIDIKVDPVDNAQCLYDLAQTQFFMENYEPAEQILNKVLNIANIPQELHDLSALLLSDVLDQLGKSAQAITILQGILDSYPNPMAIEKRLEYLTNRAKSGS